MFQCEHVAVLHVNVKNRVLQGDFAAAAAAVGFIVLMPLSLLHCKTSSVS